MTVTRGFALFLSVTTAGALINASGLATDSTAPIAPRLTAISSRVSGKTASVLIEASAPVPYVSTRPDPLTLLLDFRNVSAEGVANSVSASPQSPIAAVAVESGDSTGAPTSRVRITLSQPVEHRVRSDRNTVVIDFKGRGGPSVAPSARTTTPGGAGPLDAMKARDTLQAPVEDPIAALGLDKTAAPLTKFSEAQGSAASPRPQTPTPPPTPTPPQTPTPTPTLPAGAPAAPQTPAESSAIGQSEKKYVGHTVSFDFQGVDLRSVLRAFSDISGLNIVIDPTVQGSVDVSLRDVPWDQALDLILHSNKLGYLVDGTIVRIAPLTVLAEEESQKRKLADEQALSGELRVLHKSLSYAKGEELQALLTKSVLSQRGQVQVDPRTNTIIITDLAARLQSASDLIAILDKPQPQVEIEARIVQANKNYARALGVQWGFMGRVDPALGNTTNLAFPNNGSVSGRTGVTQGIAGTPGSSQPTGVNLPAPSTVNPSAIGLALGSINGALNLDVALSAGEISGNLRVLSTPRVSTTNNGEAEITQGVQIPIQTVANNTVTVQFKDAALTLKVTPQITSAGTVIMKIQLENAQADFSRAVNGIPPINTQRANTSVMVIDGQTTVIGGIYVSQEQVSNDRTPGLSRIPLFGWLFKRDTLNDTSTELLIFITPRIIK